MPQEERIFGPHEGETYRQYMDRLKDDGSLTRSRAAALMTTSVLMRGKANQRMDRDAFHDMHKKLERHPAMRRMMQDPQTAGLMRSGNGSGLLSLLAEKETERQKTFDRYMRPEEYVREDARFLKTAIDRLNRNAPKDTAAAGDPELRRRGKLFQEMIKRLEHARSLAESGIQLGGEKTRELIGAVKAYNDGGNKKLPGGDKEAEGSLEAMCILSRYMPEQDFRSYCRQMNKAHGTEGPRQPRHADPGAFPADRLYGSAKTAKEWYAESKVRLMKRFSPESCAEAAAIQQLSRGNPNKVIRPEELKEEIKRLSAPGSALSRTLKDETAREEFIHLASMGESEELGTELVATARKHSARAAQWQVNRSIRALVSGPANTYTAAENLANILAARELAARGDAAEPLTNRAFLERAEQMRSAPAFQRLAARYSEDPTFRRQMNRELSEDGSGTALQTAFERFAAPVRERRPEEKELQPEPQPQPQYAAAP